MYVEVDELTHDGITAKVLPSTLRFRLVLATKLGFQALAVVAFRRLVRARGTNVRRRSHSRHDALRFAPSLFPHDEGFAMPWKFHTCLTTF